MTEAERFAADWDAWIASEHMTPEIEALARKFTPWTRWLLPAHPQSYYVPSGYCQDGTLRMLRVSVATGKILWEVFGCDPDAFVPYHLT